MNPSHNFVNSSYYMNKILEYDIDSLNKSSEKTKRKLAKKTLFGKKIWRENQIPNWALKFIDDFKFFKKHINFDYY